MRWAYINAAPGIPLRGPSGASVHVRAFVEALSSHQEVRVFSALESDHRGVFGHTIRDTVFASQFSWIKRYKEFKEMAISRNLSRVISKGEWRPQFLLERHSLFSDASWRVSDQLGIPWALEVNAPICQERRQFEHLRLPNLAFDWQRDVLQACPVIFAVSKWLQQWLVEEVGCTQVHWLPNGASEKQGCAQRGRDILGLQSDKSIIGFVGSLRPWQGAHRIPDYAKRMGAFSVCIGEGEAVGADVQMSIYDEQQLADVVSAFTVAVAPYTESAPPWLCPLKLLLYRSQGVPIVSSDIGDAAWIVGESGSVVSPGNDEDFMDAIEYWMKLSGQKMLRSWTEVSLELRSYVQELTKTGYNI